MGPAVILLREGGSGIAGCEAEFHFSLLARGCPLGSPWPTAEPRPVQRRWVVARGPPGFLTPALPTPASNMTATTKHLLCAGLSDLTGPSRPPYFSLIDEETEAQGGLCNRQGHQPATQVDWLHCQGSQGSSRAYWSIVGIPSRENSRTRPREILGLPHSQMVQPKSGRDIFHFRKFSGLFLLRWGFQGSLPHPCSPD